MRPPSMPNIEDRKAVPSVERTIINTMKLMPTGL